MNLSQLFQVTPQASERIGGMISEGQIRSFETNEKAAEVSNSTTLE